MLTFEDLQVARFVREQKLVPADVLPTLMGELDELPGAPGLAPRLLEAKLLDAETARRVVTFARRQVGLEADKLYSDVALSQHSLDTERLEAILTQTTMGGRMGAKLVAEGLLTAEQDQAIIAIARQRLQAREKELLEEERRRITDQILAEPTVQLGKAERAAAQAPDETVKHSAVLPLPGQGPQDPEATEKHAAVLPLPASADATRQAVAAKPSLEGKTLRVLSGYAIEKELGRGAMGVVYLAREVQLKRTVALKVLPRSADSEAAQRFMREARAIAALDHPGIVPVFQYGEADGDYFIAMKLIDGRPLKQVAAKPLPAKRAAMIIEQVARAMAYAHEQGVVHRDLKPANILVEAGDKAWVVDFGIAKLDTEMTMTQAGEIMGTPAYMSPEQSMQLPLDARTDIYSIGAVLYAVATGQPPFVGQNAMEVLPRVATQDPPKPTSLRKDIHADLETIILVAMMKEPERRYASALELAEDLRRFQAGEPIAGQRPGALYFARRWLRRRALPLAAAALIVAGALGAWAWRGAKADEEKQRLAQQRKDDLRHRVKEKVDAIANAYAAAQKAPTTEAFIGEARKLAELLEAADAIEKDHPSVVEWRGTVKKLVHEKADERRAAAKRSFMEGSGERASATLKEAIALEPGAAENHELEALFKRPIVAVRWRTPGVQLSWARLDADLHQASDWQLPSETTPERATFAAAETKCVRLRATLAGHMDTIVDIEVKPGSTTELPPAPLATADTKDMAFVAPVPHIFGGRAKGALRSTPEQRPVASPGFLVDRTEVTRSAFLAFVNAKGYERKELWSERGRAWLDERRAAGPLSGPKDCDLTETTRGQEPVTGVTFHEAEAYAHWVGKQLPTQDQLEAAARGTLGGTYPWGNRYAKDFFDPARQTPLAVGTNPLDVSPLGVRDLAGNVREWTCDRKKDWASEQGGVVLLIVKGAFVLDPEAEALQWAKGAACTARDPKERAADIGFRCVRILKAGDF